MSGIDPLRRHEAVRRIDVLERFLAIGRTTTADARTHAAEIGISIPQFYRLAKAWSIHRDAMLLGVNDRKGAKGTRSDGLPPEVRAIMAATIVELGAHARPRDVAREVATRCEAKGLKPPSTTKVWHEVMDARATSPIRSDEAPRLIVGRLWAKLPTLVDGSLAFPEIAIALLLPDRIVLGTDVSCDPRKKANAARALQSALAVTKTDMASLDVLVDAGDLREITALDLPKELRVVASTNQTYRLLATNLGRTMGGLGLLQRPRSARPAKLTQARSAAPLECAEAIAEVSRAVSAHNETLARRPSDN